MLFALEALKARHGDCLLLHFGDPKKPLLILIDGGPAGVFKSALRPRLEALRKSRTPDGELPIEILMVSHIDDDHVKGVLELTGEMIERQDDQKPPLWKIRCLWHNSFDDIVGQASDAMFRAAKAEVGPAAFGEDVPADLKVTRESALVLANVPQGRALRQDAEKLAIEVNQPFGKLVVRPQDGKPLDLFGGKLKLRVLGPTLAQVEALQKEWDKELKKAGLAKPAKPVKAADFLDESVFNLSSLVILAEAGRKRMLLTGDARGDHILEGVEAAGLLGKSGKAHVHLLKLPHHGSHHNVDVGFFKAIIADHYVVSGDGKYGNPEFETLQMIAEARGKSAFTVHVTYRPEEFKAEYEHLEDLQTFLAAEKVKGKKYEVRFRGAGEESVLVDLGTHAYDGR